MLALLAALKAGRSRATLIRSVAVAAVVVACAASVVGALRFGDEAPARSGACAEMATTAG
jgi:hypothetical protein